MNTSQYVTGAYTYTNFQYEIDNFPFILVYDTSTVLLWCIGTLSNIKAWNATECIEFLEY